MVCSSWVNAVFIRNDFPELGTNLISALAALGRARARAWLSESCK